MSSKLKFEKIGRVSSESVEKHTSKNWDQWIKILEKAGARSWSHKEIVAFLKKKYKLTPWWQQGVTVGFENAIGRREENRDQKGLYTFTATKSISRNAKDVWKFIVSPEGQALWLEPLDEVDFAPKKELETGFGYFGEVRTVRPPKAMRLRLQDIDWDKPSILELFIAPKPKNKCIVVFSHGKLPTQKLHIEFRSRWKEALEKIKIAVEQQ